MLEKHEIQDYLKQFIKENWSDQALKIINNFHLTKHIIKFLISECERTNSEQIVQSSMITSFHVYYTILNSKYLKTYCNIEIPKFPFLASKTCDEDLLVMAKVYVETARIKYETMSEEWYTALPSALAMISMMYRSTVSTEEEIYKFEEHLLKCILKYADDFKEQTFETLIVCLINNPYTPTIPIKEIFETIEF